MYLNPNLWEDGKGNGRKGDRESENGPDCMCNTGAPDKHSYHVSQAYTKKKKKMLRIKARHDT